MVTKDAANKVLEYLKKQGPTNTFRLARKLGIYRQKILNIIKKLEEKGALDYRSGIAKFLKFPEKEKKVAKKVEIKKISPKPKWKVKHKKVRAKRKLKVLEDIQAENKKLKERLLKLEADIKSQLQLDVKYKLNEQAEHIERLEKTIKELQQKISVYPKIIRKTIIEKAPVKEEIEAKPKKFKLPKFNVAFKNIKQLRRPKFIGQKIKIGKPKVNLSQLNKNIQQLHVPEILKKGGR